MIQKPNSNKTRLKRHRRIRSKIHGTAECPRLNVFRSGKHIYAQIIDDVKRTTLVAASSLEKDFEGVGSRQKGRGRDCAESGSDWDYNGGL